MKTLLQPNIGETGRVICAIIGPILLGAAGFARGVLPDYPGRVGAVFPASWLP